MTYSVSFVGAVIGLPLLVLSALNSRTLVLGVIVIAGIVLPPGLARIHRGTIWGALAVQALTLVTIFLSWPTERLGNITLQYTEHIANWLLGCFFLCSAVEAYDLSTQLRKARQRGMGQQGDAVVFLMPPAPLPLFFSCADQLPKILSKRVVYLLDICLHP